MLQDHSRASFRITCSDRKLLCWLAEAPGRFAASGDLVRAAMTIMTAGRAFGGGRRGTGYQTGARFVPDSPFFPSPLVRGDVSFGLRSGVLSAPPSRLGGGSRSSLSSPILLQTERASRPRRRAEALVGRRTTTGGAACANGRASAIIHAPRFYAQNRRQLAAPGPPRGRRVSPPSY